MTNRKFKVIVADDHTLFRQGLKLILEDLENIEVIADVSNGKELIESTNALHPDLVIMDINMPFINGIEASKELMLLRPDLKILIVSMYSEEQYYSAVIESGVKGFILKDAENSEFRAAVSAIINGKTYFSQELLLRIIKNRKTNANISLSNREMEILKLLCQGLNTSEIAGKLFLSERTVENHRANLLDKTGCKTSLALVIFALKNNIIDTQ